MKMEDYYRECLQEGAGQDGHGEGGGGEDVQVRGPRGLESRVQNFSTLKIC
jgi:hypothetical protein